MKRCVVLLVVFLAVVCWTAGAADKEGDNVRLVTTGEILKIDLKKKTFEFRIVLDAFPGGFRGPRRGGRGAGGRFPGRFPGGPQGQGDIRYVPTMDVKVYTSERTVLKTGSNSTDFSIFQVGERVTVTGVHHGRGTDLDAIEISRVLPTP